MTGGIFINYRRDDAHGTAGRLRDHLVRDRRTNDVFMDVDNIPAGVDFVDYLNSQLAACDVLLAVIGPDWLHAKDDAGRRRLDDPADYVRLEIAAALNRKIRVVPVLVDGARLPKPDDLPEDIRALTRRNAIEVRNDKFSRDVDALADSLLDRRDPIWRRRRSALAGAAALVVLLAAWIGLHALGVAVPWPWPARLPALAAHELMLVNGRTGECLTIAAGVVFDNNVDAAQVACDGEPVRRWWLEESSVADVYKIKNVATGRCLTIAGGLNPANYVRALQYQCDDDPSRSWTITHAGGGLYEIRNRQTRKCLSLSDRDSAENSVRVGAPVQYECDGDPARRWKLTPATDAPTAASNATRPKEPAPAAGATDGLPSPDVSQINRRLAEIRAQTLPGFDPETIPPAERTIKIAVLSTGVSQGLSQALGSRLQASSVVPGESDTDDLHGLGTSVTALLAALAPSATIHTIKIFAASGQTVNRLMAEGVKKAMSDRADVIFVDGGGRSSSSELEEAVRAAVEAGALVVAPAGNDGEGSVVFPAGYPDVLAVGSLEGRDKLAEFTNRASGVLYVPGVALTTIDENANTVKRSGTSLSATVAAAMAAVVWAGKPQWSAQQVRALLVRTSADLGPVDVRNAKLGRIRRIDVTAAAKVPAESIGASAPGASLACDRKCRQQFSNCNIQTVNDVNSAAADACRAELRACLAACGKP